jgi:hypothetical protein
VTVFKKMDGVQAVERDGKATLSRFSDENWGDGANRSGGLF